MLAVAGLSGCQSSGSEANAGVVEASTTASASEHDPEALPTIDHEAACPAEPSSASEGDDPNGAPPLLAGLLPGTGESRSWIPLDASAAQSLIPPDVRGKRHRLVGRMRVWCAADDGSDERENDHVVGIIALFGESADSPIAFVLATTRSEQMATDDARAAVVAALEDDDLSRRVAALRSAP